MKILVANKFFFRNGGSEAVMFEERDRLRDRGHAVVDFSMHDERNLPSAYAGHFVGRRDYRNGGGRFEKLKSAISLVHSAEAVDALTDLIQRDRPHLVHCHNIYHQLTPSIIGAARRLGVPVALTLHDYKPVCPVYTRLRDGRPCSDCLDGHDFNVLKHRCADGSLGKSTLLYAESLAQRWLGSYEQVDAFIAPSCFMQASLAQRVSPMKMRLLYNGVDTKRIRGTGSDEGYVLYLGRLSAEKGVATLLEAHHQARAQWPLVVAGTGPLEAEVKLKYKNVNFKGHLAGQALHEVIDRAAVVVTPSEWYENCPMSVLEAMAYGKPVVGSRMGGIPELVVDEETGLLFEAGNVQALRDCLDRLMRDPALRRSMGVRARQRAEAEFSIEQHMDGLLQIYQSLV